MKGKLILEVGCGTGYGADYLSPVTSEMISIDVWKDGIASCRSKCNKSNLSFIPANALRRPFKDASFDAILSFQVIEHFSRIDSAQYISEIKRTLRNDGIFIATTPNSKLRLLPSRNKEILSICENMIMQV